MTPSILNRTARSLSKARLLRFLKSNSIDNSDKFIGLFQIKANEDGEEKTIYYMVLVPDINESEQILARNIYGEKRICQKRSKRARIMEVISNGSMAHNIRSKKEASIWS